jgi:hypothetical protein
VEVNEDIFEDKDGFQTPQSLPQPSMLNQTLGTKRGSSPGSRSTSRGPSAGRSLGYDLANVQPKLGTAKFQEASRMSDLNRDERSSKRLFTAISTPNNQFFKNKDTHQDPTRRTKRFKMIDGGILSS